MLMPSPRFCLVFSVNPTLLIVNSTDHCPRFRYQHGRATSWCVANGQLSSLVLSTCLGIVQGFTQLRRTNRNAHCGAIIGRVHVIGLVFVWLDGAKLGKLDRLIKRVDLIERCKLRKPI